MQTCQWIMSAALGMLGLPGCSPQFEKPKTISHATVAAPEAPVKVAATDAASAVPAAEIHRITLSETATKRLGIVFAEVKGTAERLEAPYNALLYDASGREWVFISPAPNVFMRASIAVDLIEADKVFYTKGPAAGSKLVTMGAAELYGIEFGVGK